VLIELWCAAGIWVRPVRAPATITAFVVVLLGALYAAYGVIVPDVPECGCLGPLTRDHSLHLAIAGALLFTLTKLVSDACTAPRNVS